MTPITTTAELAAYCQRLLGQPFVAVDTEFMRETTYWPRLCLIQAAAPGIEAVIDPLAEDLDLTPFLDVMRDTSIEKVFHAARQDVEIFQQSRRDSPTAVRYSDRRHGGRLRRTDRL